MAIIQAQPIELVLQNTTEHIDIEIVDANCDPINATLLRLKIIDPCGGTLYEDDYFAPPSPPTRIVKVGGTIGRYYYPYGNAAGETNSLGDKLFHWSVETATSIEQANIVQTTKIASARAFQLLPYLRLQIDKTAKAVEPELGVFLGYTDSNLMMYLEGGAQMLNIYGQDQFAFTVDTYPQERFRQLLLQAALWWGLMSQSVYAIDTDQRFSDQGYSFDLDKFPKLTQLLNTLQSSIEKQVQMLKLTYVSTGSVMTEMGTSFRLNQLLEAAPNGSMFRNLFTAGG